MVCELWQAVVSCQQEGDGIHHPAQFQSVCEWAAECVAECAAGCVAECAAECVAQELEKRAAELASMKEAAKASGEQIKQLKAKIASANNGDKDEQGLQVHLIRPLLECLAVAADVL